MEASESPKPMGWEEGSRVVSSSSTSTDTEAITFVHDYNSHHNEYHGVLPVIPSAPTSEQCALMNFAFRLGAEVKNNDPSFTDGKGVRQEAKLLMSLSSASALSTDNSNLVSDGSVPPLPSSSQDSSGRITPQSVTSTISGGSRRETFCFTCPSLSLEGKDSDNEGKTASHHDAATIERNATEEARDGEVRTMGVNKERKEHEGCINGSSSCPAVMLGRTLKVDDKDVTRLSADAMARNIMQSFQTAMKWRIESWVDSLSTVLVNREQQLQSGALSPGSEKAVVDALYYSNEALLVAALRQIASKIQVLETTTEFKVLHKVTNAPSTTSKRQRLVTEETIGLEEGEYVYDILHVLEMQCALTVSTPAGNVNIDLNVPGTIKGTFLSSEDNYNEELTDVNVNVNTTMLATMIERSSRIAVRCSAEALLKGETVEPKKEEEKKKETEVKAPPKATLSPKTTTHSPQPTTAATRSPKRKLSEDDGKPVSGLVVITPGRDTASSPSDFADSDSDGDHKSDKLQIPDNFSRKSRVTTTVLSPQASRFGQQGTPNLSFASRLPPKKTYMTSSPSGPVVTPMKTASPEFEHREQGPTVPLLGQTSVASLNPASK
jgi:hypothetical protein